MSKLAHIKIGIATDQEHEAVIRALYGSVDKLIVHPNYVSMKEKRDYLVGLKGRLNDAVNMARNKVKWWDIFGKTMCMVGSLWVNKVMKDMDHLIKCCEGQLSMPFGIVVKAVEDDFSIFIDTNRNIIRQVNLDLNYTADQYV